MRCTLTANDTTLGSGVSVPSTYTEPVCAGVELVLLGALPLPELQPATHAATPIIKNTRSPSGKTTAPMARARYQCSIPSRNSGFKPAPSNPDARPGGFRIAVALGMVLSIRSSDYAGYRPAHSKGHDVLIGFLPVHLAEARAGNSCVRQRRSS
jgi:hypothetical protein